MIGPPPRRSITFRRQLLRLQWIKVRVESPTEFFYVSTDAMRANTDPDPSSRTILRCYVAIGVSLHHLTIRYHPVSIIHPDGAIITHYYYRHCNYGYFCISGSYHHGRDYYFDIYQPFVVPDDNGGSRRNNNGNCANDIAL